MTTRTLPTALAGLALVMALAACGTNPDAPYSPQSAQAVTYLIDLGPATDGGTTPTLRVIMDKTLEGATSVYDRLAWDADLDGEIRNHECCERNLTTQSFDVSAPYRDFPGAAYTFEPGVRNERDRWFVSLGRDLLLRENEDQWSYSWLAGVGRQFDRLPDATRWQIGEPVALDIRTGRSSLRDKVTERALVGFRTQIGEAVRILKNGQPLDYEIRILDEAGQAVVEETRQGTPLSNSVFHFEHEQLPGPGKYRFEITADVGPYQPQRRVTQTADFVIEEKSAED